MLHDLGISIIFFGRVGPTGEVGPSTGLDEDFNTKLDDLLRDD